MVMPCQVRGQSEAKKSWVLVQPVGAAEATGAGAETFWARAAWLQAKIALMTSNARTDFFVVKFVLRSAATALWARYIRPYITRGVAKRKV
jgi:hypothetical protein